MLFQSATAVALLASFVTAQTQTNTTVNIGALDSKTKTQWCAAQYDACIALCSKDTSKNDCDEGTLAFDCACRANNSAPALQYYLNTIPTFLCQQTFEECNANNVGNRAAQDQCVAAREANCGKLNPLNYTAPATTTTTSAEQTATSAAGGAVSSAAGVATTTSSRAGAMPTMAATFGSGVVAAGVAAAFGLLL